MPEGSGRASRSIGPPGNPDIRALAGAMTILLGLLHAIVGAPTGSGGQPLHEAGAPGPGARRGLFGPVPRGQQRVPPGVVVRGGTPAAGRRPGEGHVVCRDRDAGRRQAQVGQIDPGDVPEADHDRCVGWGTCEFLLPHVFVVGEGGVQVLRPQPWQAGEDAVRDAVAQCPTGRWGSPTDGTPSSAAGLAPA